MRWALARLRCLSGWHDVERDDLSPEGFRRLVWCRRPGCNWPYF